MNTTTEIFSNRYEIKKTLGEGGFGRTYLAIDGNVFDKKCVLKEFVYTNNNPKDQEIALEFFNQEAKILSALQHPQIPNISDYFREDGRSFIVQEYIDGQTYAHVLKEYISYKKVFSEAEILKLLKAMLPILTYIHEKGIYHRDISPDNIILPNDPNAKPYLIDFGVGKVLINNSIINQNNKLNNLFVGKKGYAPKEQMNNGESLPSSDLYALAITAIVLLTGKQPDSLRNENQQYHWYSFANNISEPLRKLLDKMLLDEPNDRYQSASEVLETLLTIYPENTELSLRQPHLFQFQIKRTIAIFLTLAGISILVPKFFFNIQPFCQIIGNCPQNDNFLSIYNQGLQNAEDAVILAEKATYLSQLTTGYERLKNAIAQLKSIPVNEKIYPQVIQILPNYQNKLVMLEKRINEEDKAQQLLDETEKTIKSIPEDSDLEKSKTFYQKALTNLRKFPTNSLLSDQAKHQKESYQAEIKDIEEQIKAHADQNPPPQSIEIPRTPPEKKKPEPKVEPKKPVESPTKPTNSNDEPPLWDKPSHKQKKQAKIPIANDESPLWDKPSHKQNPDEKTPLW